MGCGACSKLGKCVQDDCVNDALKLLDDADGFVFGTPVHYAAAGGSIGGFLDRLFYAGGSKMAFKPGAAVVSCRRGGASAAFDQINKYFTINNMPVASAQYWNMVHGTTPDEVVRDEEGMQNMRTLGRNIAWLVKCIALAKENGLDHPQLEGKIKTNYIR
jgi:multimeric flavodoxin WrbA